MIALYRIMGGYGEHWVRTLHTGTGEPLPKSLCPHFPDAAQARAWVEARVVGAVLDAIEQAWAARKSPRTSRNLANATGLPIARVRFALRVLESTRQAESRTVHYNASGPLAHAQGWIPCGSTRSRILHERAQHAAECES